MIVVLYMYISFFDAKEPIFRLMSSYKSYEPCEEKLDSLEAKERRFNNIKETPTDIVRESSILLRFYNREDTTPVVITYMCEDVPFVDK